jgi:hypothetical protein
MLMGNTTLPERAELSYGGRNNRPFKPANGR